MSKKITESSGWWVTTTHSHLRGFTLIAILVPEVLPAMCAGFNSLLLVVNQSFTQ